MPRGNPNPSPATRWKPGVSANPGGMARGKRVSTSLAHLLDMTAAEVLKFRKRKDLVQADLIALKILDNTRRSTAKVGHQMTDIILDRTEGKVTQKHELEGLNPYLGTAGAELAGLIERLKKNVGGA